MFEIDKLPREVYELLEKKGLSKDRILLAAKCDRDCEHTPCDSYLVATADELAVLTGTFSHEHDAKEKHAVRVWTEKDYRVYSLAKLDRFRIEELVSSARFTAMDEEGKPLYSQYSHYNLDFNGNLKTHSVIFNSKSHDTPLFNMRAQLGKPVSGGCLRLTVTDAKWLYDRFEIGDSIEIVDGTKHPTLKQQLKDTLPEI